MSDATFPFGGIYAATICPLDASGALDAEALHAHHAAVLATEGMAGLLVNGHAGENFALERQELSEVVRTARSVAGTGHKVVAGINCERSDIAARMAEDAAAAGADAVMVFPPFSWALGADDRAIVTHHRMIAVAAGVPMMLFQGAVGSGKTAFRPEVLARLLEIETVVGIKEGSWETAAYDATRRLTRRLRPDVAVMASGDEHLFPCFALGSDGSLVSLAAVVPELIVALDRAVARGDMAAGRALHERLYLLGRIVYGAPGHLATLRLKTCLHLLGRLASTRCRPPVDTLPETEVARLREALAAAGLLRAGSPA
ncbi:dihydrodipicolinate synthase family protein [Xanthobacter flavus]|uniref:dihydrodipicolinate synthase family protein n=1 Tax=Xanthobacter flavus TaxID=281 RepID=UPI001AE616F8|nr:dihydrodipicolinate synthase family protein [Xanthobacter flavus]MBP2151013.1 4-hydroxy-tetrahydrodipicolinate synthase [Xanthobacter flavus]